MSHNNIRGGGGLPIKECSFFGNISVTKYIRTCQSIKYYSFTDSDIINAEHCEVDFESEIYKQINKNHQENNIKNNIYM